MTEKKWDDKQIEELLDNMPDMQDNRSKSDILARLKQDERLNTPRRKKTEKMDPGIGRSGGIACHRASPPIHASAKRRSDDGYSQSIKWWKEQRRRWESGRSV